MFDYEKFKEMSPEEVMIYSKLAMLAEKAKMYEKMIHEVYLFHIGEERIKIWADSHNVERELLTRDGTWIWQGNYRKELYVSLTAKNLFERFTASEIRNSDLFETLKEDEKKIIEERYLEYNCLGRFLSETKKEYYKLHPEKVETKKD